MNKPSLALFDFDGTITTKDTLFQIILFSKGWAAFILGLLWVSPVMVLYKLGVIPNWRAKEIFLSTFFRSEPLTTFQDLCDRFAAEKLPALIRKKALSTIEEYKASGTRVVVVSASPGNWIRKWTDSVGVELIATRLEVKEGKLTGRIEGKNCYGVEKVNRIKACLSLDQYQAIDAYGDTKGDLPMLALAQQQYYKPFRR